MTKYEMELDIPMRGDVDKFIEALREYGYPKIILRVETSDTARSKYAVAREISNSVSAWWGNYSYTSDWWNERLKAVRGERAEGEDWR